MKDHYSIPTHKESSHNHFRRAKAAAYLTPLYLLGAGGILAKSANAASPESAHPTADLVAKSHESADQTPEQLISHLKSVFGAQANRVIAMYESGNKNVSMAHDKLPIGASSQDDLYTYWMSRRDGTYQGKPTYTEYILQIVKGPGQDDETFQYSGPIHWEVAHHVLPTEKSHDPARSIIKGPVVAVSSGLPPVIGKSWSLVNSPGGTISPKTSVFEVSPDFGAQVIQGEQAAKPIGVNMAAGQFGKFLKLSQEFIDQYS